MSRQPPSALLQCRGRDRRATPWHLLVAVLLVAGFVGAVGLLKAVGAAPAYPAADQSR